MTSYNREPIAIVGIGCRFPGAANPTAFWRLLRDGVDAIREAPADRWRTDRFYDPNPMAPGKTHNRRSGFIEGVDQFDWRTLRISPREAKFMDPQQRLLLEVTWEALEDAGLPLEEVAGSLTSVFMGVAGSDYWRLQSRDWSKLDGYAPTGNALTFTANRVSFVFDLRGPSFASDAGCASSVVTTYYACQSLWTGEATMAIAGGVNLMLTPELFIAMSKAGLFAKDFRVKTWDAHADGFNRGEGAGVVVLKPLSAVRPSDRVYALIRGAAIGHSGHGAWIMAPNPESQQTVIREAYRRAGLDPAEADYVELHGTGTPKGDPIEAKSLGAVVGKASGRQHPCYVGSVKSNFGHLESASGIASIIKVALSLYHGQIPPTLHLETVNPEIPTDELGLEPARQLIPWPEKPGPRVAGVTVVSMSGVNAHMVLEGAGGRWPVAGEESGLPLATCYLLPLSARSPDALKGLARSYQAWLADEEQGGRLSLLDICYTAGSRRSHFEHRLAVVGRSRQELAAGLAAYANGQTADGLYTGSLGGDRQPKPIPESLLGDGRLGVVVNQLLDYQTEKGYIVPAGWLESEMDRAAGLEGLAILYTFGRPIAWADLYAGGRMVTLPNYAWQRDRIWLDWLTPEEVSRAPEVPVDQLSAVSMSVAADRPPERIRPPVDGGRPIPENGKVATAQVVLAPGSESALARRLVDAPLAQRRNLLQSYVRHQILTVMGFDSAYPLPLQQRLFEAGLDSVTAVALATRFQEDLGVDLPAATIFDYPTIESFAEYLARDVLGVEMEAVAKVESGRDEEKAASAARDATLLAQIEELSDDEAEALLLAKLAAI